MAIIERPTDTPALSGAGGAVVTPTSSYGYFRRPVQTTGWKSWAFTVDHKKIGIMYGVVAMLFFFVGGFEALLIRAQLAQADGTILSADKYNQMFTMHATTMVFLFVMPMAAAFANYMMPLQIGARDVAFPRLNALSLWTFVFGGIFINTSWILGGAADGGWFMYAPNSSVPFSPTNGVDFWVLGLLMTGIASQVGAINLIVTALNMRAPGMTLMRMPIFTWMALVVQFLLLFAIPIITVALFLLLFQRNFDATFFSVADGADPLLWQHLFWLFGHPEVYILVLPAFGIISEVLPTFSRKPLFGYPFVVFSGAAIGLVGFGVWAHHMFAAGLGPISEHLSPACRSTRSISKKPTTARFASRCWMRSAAQPHWKEERSSSDSASRAGCSRRTVEQSSKKSSTTSGLSGMAVGAAESKRKTTALMRANVSRNVGSSSGASW